MIGMARKISPSRPLCKERHLRLTGVIGHAARELVSPNGSAFILNPALSPSQAVRGLRQSSERHQRRTSCPTELKRRAPRGWALCFAA